MSNGSAASIAARIAGRSVTSSTSVAARPPASLDLPGGFGDLGGGAGDQGDVGADLGQRGGGGQTDAATGTGDQGATAVEAHGGEARQRHVGAAADRPHTGSRSSSFHSSADAPARAWMRVSSARSSAAGPE